jgi:hypothetical protein
VRIGAGGLGVVGGGVQVVEDFQGLGGAQPDRPVAVLCVLDVINRWRYLIVP